MQQDTCAMPLIQRAHIDGELLHGYPNMVHFDRRVVQPTIPIADMCHSNKYVSDSVTARH